MERHSTPKLLLFALILVGTLVGLFYLGKNPVFVKKVLNDPINTAVEIIKKEVKLPGALVAKVESSRAYLTSIGVFALTNKERANASLNTFATNSTLDDIAEQRLNNMFDKQYFDHVSPAGESASTEAEKRGFEYISIGENIALGNFENDEVLVNAWMASEGHRKNILNSKFTELGVAVGKGVYNGKSTWIGVQIFARPVSVCPKIDANLKNTIDYDEAKLKTLQNEISRIETELYSMEKDKYRNREEYNQKVNEYNSLAERINNLIFGLKKNIANYNEGVRAFNVCLGN